MKHNYPYSVTRAVKKWYLYNDEGITEERVQQLTPETVLDVFLEWEGIIGYTNDIIAIMNDRGEESLRFNQKAKKELLEGIEAYLKYFKKEDFHKKISSFICFMFGYLGVNDEDIKEYTKYQDFQELTSKYDETK